MFNIVRHHIKYFIYTSYFYLLLLTHEKTKLSSFLKDLPLTSFYRFFFESSKK